MCIGQYYYDDYYFKRERPCMHISHMRKIIFDMQALGSGDGGDPEVITRNYIIIVIIESTGCVFSSATQDLAYNIIINRATIN